MTLPDSQRRADRRAGLIPLSKVWLPTDPLKRYVDTTQALRHKAGIDNHLRRRYLAAVQEGRITADHADKFCTRVLRVHPHDIWGDRWWNEGAPATPLPDHFLWDEAPLRNTEPDDLHSSEQASLFD